MADECDRRHAGCGHDCAGAAFQLRDRLRKEIAGGIARAGVIVSTLVAETAKRERRRQMDWRHDTASRVIAFQSSAHGLRLLLDRCARDGRGTAVGDRVYRGVHQSSAYELSGSTALLRSTRIDMRAVASIFHTAVGHMKATHTAHLLIQRIAGVGTFPSWLGFAAVAPASKGLSLGRSR